MEMREALHVLVSPWRTVPELPADQRATAHARATVEWEASTTRFLAEVEQITQIFTF